MKLTMTRVLTPLAALAIAFGVQAAAVSSDGFETATSTVPGSRTGWSFTAGPDSAADASAITAYGEAAKPIALPDGMTAGDYFLKLSTEDGTLFRNMDNDAGAAVQIPDAGLFVDTDVQFTLTDSTDRPTPVAADKFIIWLESNETAGTTNLCVYGGSFAYAAGTVSSGIPTVYTLSGVDIAPGSWHRLTVKAVAKASATFQKAGFEVYIDGTPMVSDEYFFGGASTLSYLNDSDFVAALGDDAWNMLAAKTFFPSLVEGISSLAQVGFSGEGKIDDVLVTKDIPGFLPAAGLTVTWDSSLVSSVNLIGQTLTAPNSLITIATNSTLTILKTDLVAATGVDLDGYDFSVTSSEPGIAAVSETTGGFIITPTGSQLHGSTTITLGLTANNTAEVTVDFNDLLVALSADGNEDDLVSVTYTLGGTSQTVGFDDLDNQSTITGTVTLNDTFTIAITFAANSGWTAVFDDDAGLTRSGTTFTLTSLANRNIEIGVTAIKPVATVNGVAYETFADALDAAALAGTATIQLADNVTLDDAAVIDANKNITIDLAGKTITVDSADVVAAVFSVDADGTLNITNSTETVGAVVAGTASACIANAGTLNLQAGKFGGLISGGDIYVTGGAYTAEIAGATLPTGYSFQMLTGAITYIYGIAPTAYTITYMNGANELTGLTPTSFTVEDAVTLPAEVDLGVVGVSFDGWTNATGTVTGWAAGELTGNQVFYAKTAAVVLPSVAEIVGGAGYATLKAAVEAASAGDTVRVLADCTVDEPITFTKGITVSNDFTVTVANNGNITYAYRVINGTTVPVTICGTGTFTESGAASGSQFLIGSSTNKTAQGIGIVAGSLVLNGCTITNGQSNVVKVENGTFTMNGGTIDAAGLRGIKADTEDDEDGAYDATVIINGGTIKSTKAALATSTKAGNGAASVTINGGEITGPLSKGADTTLLIPGTSTARFDRGQSDFCASGYETTLDNGWYVVTAAPTGTEPGATVGEYNTQADAEAAAAAATVAVPAAVSAIAGIDETAYKTLFAGKVVAIDGGAKPYAVVIELTSAAAADLQEQANAGATNALANISARSITIAATPGLYYSIKSGATLDNMTESATRTLATGSEVQLDMPSLGTAGFYQVLINITDK